jgi:hypothetical protein
MFIFRLADKLINNIIDLFANLFICRDNIMTIKFSELLPQRFQNTTINTFLDNTVQRFMTPDNTHELYGWVGNKTDESSYYIAEDNLYKQINQLEPFIDVSSTNGRKLISFADIIKKMDSLGVDLTNFSEWGAVQSYNFAPPINYDKFVNYNQYYWISTSDPQYYCIETGGTSDWSKQNFWMHADDADAVDLSMYTQATRPIIEYLLSLESELNSYLNDGKPDVTGEFYIQKKTKSNQIPLFNTYYSNGDFSGYVSRNIFL